MPKSEKKRVVVHHKALNKEVTVRPRQVKVLAASGWESGPLPKSANKSNTEGK